MIDIKLPRTLREFGYRMDFPATSRRKSLLNMTKYSGKDSVLFNLSSTMFMLKKSGNLKDYNILKNDLKWMLRKGNII